jgi:hypothetical protein
MMLQAYRMQRRGVGTTGQVEATGELEVPADMGGAILGPAIVDVWDGPRSGRTLDPASRTFVFSAGHPWPFDPRPWMVGNTSVLTLSASVAAQRWRDIRLWETQSGHTACLPVRPPIWEDDWDSAAAPLTGLRAAEQRQLPQVGGLPTAGPGPANGVANGSRKRPANGVATRPMPPHPPPSPLDTRRYPAHPSQNA